MREHKFMRTDLNATELVYCDAFPLVEAMH